MNFNELTLETKNQLHVEVKRLAMSIGGTNVFLQMIEDIKKKNHMLY